VGEGGNPIDSAQDAITIAMDAMETYALAEGDGGGPETLMTMAPGDDQSSCEWRQYLRVGFDGLGYEGPSKDEKDATYSGVNVLILAVSGDDCSQGVYLDVNGGSNDFSDLPPEDERPDTTCDDPEMDAYFGLPPDNYEEFMALDDVALNLVWNPSDLVIGIVRRMTSPLDADADKSAALPRRLRAVVDRLTYLGAEVVPIFVEGVEDPEFQERIGVLERRIAARNSHQVCVPENLVGSNEAAFDADVGKGDGLYRPLDDTGLLYAAGVREDVSRKCRVFRIVANRFDDGTGDPRNTRIVELDAWKIGTDTDRHAGCSRGWTVVIDPEILQPATGEVFLRCLAD